MVGTLEWGVGLWQQLVASDLCRVNEVVLEGGLVVTVAKEGVDKPL